MKKRYLVCAAALALAAGMASAQVRSASQPQKLIDSSVGLMSPVWSPDGSKIAATGDNYCGIYVADADGTNLRLLTSDAGAGYKMSWSADSRSLTGRVNIADGARVMRQMRSYDVATGAAANVGSPLRAGAPKAGATGLFAAMLADPAGVASATPALAQFAGRTVINPALAPDGSAIAFQIPGKGMWLINADGSGLRSLGKGSHAAWLPDSRTIVYTIVEDNGSQFTTSTLMSMDVRTGFTATVLAGDNILPLTPAVSPDGSKVAFENAKDASIYVVNLKK